MAKKKAAKSMAQGKRKRDDFRGVTKQELARRVSYLCSNPECRKRTAGPTASPHGSVNLGVASHIEAASPLGPRANHALTAEERRSIENGIWLCQNCAKLIDSDEKGHSAADLRAWKHEAEEVARRCLKTSGSIQPSDARRIIRVESSDWHLWREMHAPPDSLLNYVTCWLPGELRYSCRLSLRNEAAHEELLREARVVFRRNSKEIYTDTDSFHDQDILLPSGRWISIDIDSGMKGSVILEEGMEVVFNAEIVGTTSRIEHRVALVAERDVT